jgi:hypothetical protein
MAPILNIIAIAVALMPWLFVLLASGRTRALVKSIFSRPRTDSTLIKIGNRWVDVDNPADAMKGHVPGQGDKLHRPTPRRGSVRSGHDSRNGGPDDHG